jgi:hypothetical protein
MPITSYRYLFRKSVCVVARVYCVCVCCVYHWYVCVADVSVCALCVGVGVYLCVFARVDCMGICVYVCMCI